MHRVVKGWAGGAAPRLGTDALPSALCQLAPLSSLRSHARRSASRCWTHPLPLLEIACKQK